jgi:hypothetical protein
MVLLVALPCVAVTGRVRPRRAGRAARWWVLVAARLSGVRFERRGHLECRPGVAQVLVANHSSPSHITAIAVI